MLLGYQLTALCIPDFYEILLKLQLVSKFKTDTRNKFGSPLDCPSGYALKLSQLTDVTILNLSLANTNALFNLVLHAPE